MVALAVHEKGVLPDRAWDMTLPDLCLLLTPPEEKWLEVSNAIEGQVICFQLQERIDLLASLTLEQRCELEELKSRLM